MKLIFVMISILSLPAFATYVAANSSGNLTVNGFVYNSGAAVTDAGVSATVQIQDQSNCALYTETFASTITINGGAYSITLGVNGSFPGGQTKLSQIFDPTNSSIAPCSTNGSTAKWHAAITSMSGPGGTYISSSPLYIPISSVPFATISENVYATTNSTLTSLPNLGIAASQVTGLGTLALLSYPGGTTSFLRADGTWSAGGSGTVTGVTSANSDIAVSVASPNPSLTLNSGTAGGAGDANKIAKLSATGVLAAAMIPTPTTISGSITGGQVSSAVANATAAVTATSATNVTGIVAIANGGTGQITATAAINSLLPTQAGNTGMFLSTNGATASWAAVANFSWVSTSSASYTVATNTGVILNGASQSVALPSVCALGDRVIVQGRGTGQWTVTGSTSQMIDRTGATGTSQVSYYPNDSMTLVCVGGNLWQMSLASTPGLLKFCSPGTMSFSSSNGGTGGFVAPDGCHTMTVQMWGAGGGSSANSAGGYGAYISGTLPLVPGSFFLPNIGSGGYCSSCSQNNNNGGGGAGYLGQSGAGGGSTSLLWMNQNQNVATAGGGGGAGVASADSGGWAGAGSCGATSGAGNFVGQPGTSSAGGAAGTGGTYLGTAGSSNQGGNGGGMSAMAGGGGGGGGTYGGGGGGASNSSTAGGGGGGWGTAGILSAVNCQQGSNLTVQSNYVSGVGLGGAAGSNSGGGGLIVITWN